MDTLEQERRATRMARNFLAGENIATERLDVDGDGYVCELRVSMPGNPDLSLRVRGRSRTEQGARDHAYAELDAKVREYFTNPARGDAIAQSARRLLPYEPNPLGFQRVRAAARAEGIPEPDSFVIGRAAMKAGLAPGGEKFLSIGDVLNLLLADRPHQAALLG